MTKTNTTKTINTITFSAGTLSVNGINAPASYSLAKNGTEVWIYTGLRIAEGDHAYNIRMHITSKDPGYDQALAMAKAEAAAETQPKAAETTKPQPKAEKAAEPQPKAAKAAKTQPKAEKAAEPQPKAAETTKPQPKAAKATKAQPKAEKAAATVEPKAPKATKAAKPQPKAENVAAPVQPKAAKTTKAQPKAANVAATVEPKAPKATKAAKPQPKAANVAAPVQPKAADDAKSWIGTTITGKGWNIAFDAATSKTRVLFQDTPTDAQKAAIEAAGFYWSNAMGSWNKKLTCKAHRAALALAATLNALA